MWDEAGVPRENPHAQEGDHDILSLSLSYIYSIKKFKDFFLTFKKIFSFTFSLKFRFLPNISHKVNIAII